MLWVRGGSTEASPIILIQTPRLMDQPPSQTLQIPVRGQERWQIPPHLLSFCSQMTHINFAHIFWPKPDTNSEGEPQKNLKTYS